MRMRWAGWALAVVLVTIAGCGDDGGTDDADGGDGGGTLDGRVEVDGGGEPGCGDGVVQDGEACDDGNTDDGDSCRGDCGSDYSCGNEIVDTAASGSLVDEVCDDGNGEGGDGCSADCLSDETCGNAIVDEDAGEVCDDGNTDDGDACSADCSVNLLCGNGDVDGDEECDDGGTEDGDGCDASCRIERCGNGRVDAGEACDDGDVDEGDGCRSDCTFTCTADTDCADTDVCNGTETCANGGSDTSACVAGTPAGNGTECGSGLICNAGSCVAVACGDGIVSGAEQCDDANTTDGDGCDADCTFTCSSAADCGDGNLCNGAEACTNAGTATSQCTAGTPASDGTDCGGGRICRAGACSTPGCGDGVVSGAEQCEDGNSTDGDGCDNDCRWTCTAATAAADCGDGNVCNGAEVCTNGGTLNSRCGAGTPPANGTACGGGNICVTGGCVAPRCGDGIVSAPEQCDDTNTTNGDGCDNDCTFTCSGAADCSDGNVCNGAEVCTGAGTLASRCGAGAAAADGTLCDADGMAGTRDICRTGMCRASTCGDGYLDTGRGEQCDDGGTANGDGYSSTCTTEVACGNGIVEAGEQCDDGGGCLNTSECSMSSECSYVGVCTPGRFCDGGANDLQECAVAADCPSGTCRVATNTCTIGGRQGLGCWANSDCPNSGTCAAGAGAGRCGDGITACNMDSQCAALDRMCAPRSIDGCSARCNTETVYRVVTAALADPRARYIIDISSTVNGIIQDEIDAYGLNFLIALDPQVTTPGMSVGILNFTTGDCDATGCTGATSVASPSYGVSGGTTVCLQPVASTTNSSIAENRPTASGAGNCLASGSLTLTLTLAGIPIPLQNAQVGAEYRAGTPNRLVDGLLMGFLPEAVANSTYLPSDITVVGGRSLGSILHPDDRDMNGTVRGWWLYLNFTATQVPIMPAPAP